VDVDAGADDALRWHLMTDTYPIRTRRFSRREYEQLVEHGFFGCNERLELLDGLLLVKEPQSSTHMTALRLVEDALRIAFGRGWDVRGQGPVALDRRSEPEPDVSVVRGSPRDYREAHPGNPVLVVEVALASLRLDRTRKCRAYARAGVPEYWIVNLVDRALEVHREPVLRETPRRRWAYRSVQPLGPDASVSPLAAPAARIAVADLLP
jgi:Uma2 family endonuclease